MSNAFQASDRVIRVFVSSTFRDMQAERDELVLKIFPQLRRLCEERGVTWGEIDLRWGITEEQSERGEVLPICLEEIRRCRPYFIGLLGERYGWIPDAIPAEVLEREPWIREYADGTDENRRKSVTELEILHGVLNNPEMTDHAFFYFRDPDYIKTVPQKSRNDFTSENTASTEKLKQLKDNIRQQHRDGKLKYEPRGNYPDAKSLGERVLADFTALINSLYPEGTQPSPLDRERMDHEAFARSRAGVYIGRQEYFDRLDAHVASDSPPLVVLGESGGGKSALLSNWALSRFPPSALDPQPSPPFLLLHFIGASPDSANAIGLLRRIMLELKQRFDLPDEIPAEPAQIREAFPSWLAQVAGRGRIVLVLDALNQLEDIDNAPDLGWLPRVFPKYCRVIVSTLPGRSLKALEQRGWLEATPPLEVHPLDEPERRRLIHDFLKQYTRDLGPARTDRVALAPQTANPLYLRVLLNELRVFGVHEKLGDEINRYLEAKDPRELYGKVIARWEKIYSDGTNLVRDTLSLIWGSRNGLSETELLESLGQPGRPLPRAIWSPLFLAMSDAVVTRSGLLTFAHEFLRNAVRDICLSDELRQLVVHRRLADYFQQQPTWNDRKLEELPWQLAKASEWQGLHDVLTGLDCFILLNFRNEYELLGYWLQLKPRFDLATSYTAAFTQWSQDDFDTTEMADVANVVASLMRTAACHTSAELLMRRALAMDEQSYGTDHPSVTRDLNGLAMSLMAMNRLEEAEPLIRRALSIDEKFHGADRVEVGRDLANLAQILQASNRLNEAESVMRRALAIGEQSYGSDDLRVATLLSNLAGFLQSTNQLHEAEFLVRRALAIEEKAYGTEHPNVAMSLNILSLILMSKKQLEEAELLLRRMWIINEHSYGPDHPLLATSLNNLTTLLMETGRLMEAEPLMRRAIDITEQSSGPGHPIHTLSLNNLALLLKTTNRLKEAENIYRRVVALDEMSCGAEHPNVAIGLNNLAQLLQATKRFAEAEQLMRRTITIDELSYGPKHPNVARGLNNLAVLLLETKRPMEAEPLIRRALSIDEISFGTEHPNVARRLSNLAMVLQARGSPTAEIEPMMRRALAICEAYQRDTGHDHPSCGVIRRYLTQVEFRRNPLAWGCLVVISIGLIVLLSMLTHWLLF